MGWRVWGQSYDSDSDFANGIYSVRFTPNSNIILRIARTWVIFCNNPGLTTLTSKIYIDDDNAVGDLLHSSTTTWTKSQIISESNGAREIYFNFDDIPLHASEHYHLKLMGTSSGFSESSHLAWKSSYPDPVYSGGFAGSASKLPQYPFDLSLIGARF